MDLVEVAGPQRPGRLSEYYQYLHGAGGSRYDAFQAKVERRYADFSLLLGYTWVEDARLPRRHTQTGGGGAPADQYNPGFEKADSSHDIPHWMNITRKRQGWSLCGPPKSLGMGRMKRQP